MDESLQRKYELIYFNDLFEFWNYLGVIHLVHTQNFQKTDIAYPLIRTGTLILRAYEMNDPLSHSQGEENEIWLNF